MSEENLKPIKVKISGYQSIEKLEFEINGFTCIMGKTNIGKSAIVRAISSAILNNPVVGMVRKGAPYASVELVAPDWSFLWEKSDRGVNRYHIGGKVYDKVGQKQLAEIADMGFKTVKIGQDDMTPWLASQFAPIFLLDRSGPQITDFISEVSKLNVLQDSVILSARGKKRSSDEANLKTNEASSFRKKQASVVGIKDVEKLQKDLESQYKSIERYENSLAEAKSFHSKLESSAEAIRYVKPFLNLKIPEAPESVVVNRLSEARQFLRRLNEAASGVIVLKKAASVSIPVMPLEAKELAKAKKYSWIPDEAAAIKRLESVSSIRLPTMSQSEIDNLIKMKSLKESLDSAKKAVGSIPSLNIPGLSINQSDVDSLKLARSFYEKILQSMASFKESNSLSTQINKELDYVEEEMKKIPICPTCKRAGASHITHQDST